MGYKEIMVSTPQTTPIIQTDVIPPMPIPPRVTNKRKRRSITKSNENDKEKEDNMEIENVPKVPAAAFGRKKGLPCINREAFKCRICGETNESFIKKYANMNPPRKVKNVIIIRNPADQNEE